MKRFKNLSEPQLYIFEDIAKGWKGSYNKKNHRTLRSLIRLGLITHRWNCESGYAFSQYQVVPEVLEEWKNSKGE